MTAKNREEAWKMADTIFPTDYMKDDLASSAAGYPIYKSTAEGNESWISDLGCRLEVNTDDGKTVNVWIEEEDHFEDIEVTVTHKTGETRVWPTYEEFRKDMRFWMSCGKEYTDNENHYTMMIYSLRSLGEHNSTMTTMRSGLPTTFRYIRCK